MNLWFGSADLNLDTPPCSDESMRFAVVQFGGSRTHCIDCQSYNIPMGNSDAWSQVEYESKGLHPCCRICSIYSMVYDFYPLIILYGGCSEFAQLRNRSFLLFNVSRSRLSQYLWKIRIEPLLLLSVHPLSDLSLFFNFLDPQNTNISICIKKEVATFSGVFFVT